MAFKPKPYSKRPDTYDPANLLDAVQALTHSHNDRGLAEVLGVGHPVLSRIRTRNRPLNAALLIRMHDITGVDLADLRELAGDRREVYRLTESAGREYIPIKKGKTNGSD